MGSSGESDERHRTKITPEQRRVLGPARSRQDWTHHDEGDADARVEAKAPAVEQKPPTPTRPESSIESERPRPIQTRSGFSRALEVQNIALGVGALFVLFIAFYAGKKFDYWRYQLVSQARAKSSIPALEKFAANSPNELIDQAIVDERIGNWKEAATRLLAAKHKNLLLPGLLFHAAKLYYDHSDFDSADAWFDRAIAFREDVAESDYYRGMIAKGRGDLAAAERFFEAAANAAPFNADYLYSWAEALRRDHRPKEAILRYQQAALRAQENQANICRFKARVAEIEAGDVASVTDELDKRITAGPLSVDWLMTQAALDLHAGKIEDAAHTIEQARTNDPSFMRGHFAACASDKFFTDAATSYSQLANALQMATTR
jgi:tetratricopeptide (TPR) repeat protein